MTEPARRSAMRRLGRWLTAAAAATLAACGRAMQPLSPSAGAGAAPQESGADPEAAQRNRYRGIPGGGELYIDADYDTHGHGFLYTFDGTMFATGQFSPRMSGTRGYFGDEKNGGLPLPKTLRMLRYPEGAERNRKWDYSRLQDQPPFFGPPLVDVTVPVASRIPDAVLDRIRQYRGSLKLKLRLTKETLLVGWQINGMKDYPHA